MTRGLYDRSLTQRERRSDQRRKLLLAATHVFSKRGFAAASVEAIVTKAEMSRRTFYEHFDDLADALLAVHDASAKIAMRVVKDAVAAEKLPRKQLEAGIRAFLELVAANGDFARVLFREVRAAGPQYEMRREKVLAGFGEALAGAIDGGHASGDFRDKASPILVYALSSAVEAVGMRYVEKREEDKILEALAPLVMLVERAFGAK